MDEVGSMPESMQAKLLRVIQDREIVRLGGTRSLELDFRVIAATNERLEEMIQKDVFRRDLYYRLNIFRIHTPPLRFRVNGDVGEILTFGRMGRP